MSFKGVIALLIVSITTCLPVWSQTIHGDVMDMETRQPLKDVTIVNVYTTLNITTDTSGGFIIAANSGQLLEFRKQGYKTVHVRIPAGYIPPYFRIIMKQGLSEIKGMDIAKGDRYDPRDDSIKYHDVYQRELEFPRLSAIDAIAHPFSAMSGKNKEVWQFQDDYSDFQKQKYVDKTFNEELVTKFTGLKGDSLRYYMRRYRPSYEQLKAMSDYSFYNYIKATVTQYRSIQTPRSGY
jgi:hypothetical protein